METKSIKKNYLYNLIYQILILVLPILTTPYVSRVLGSENIGIYSFSISIVTYFMLFGSLGATVYGQREIAYIRENKNERKKVFLEILIFRFITMAIAIFFYFCIFARNNIYQKYYKILILYLFATAFDISWFFQGLEDFKKIVTRNIIVRVISVLCVFLFVKSRNRFRKIFINILIRRFFREYFFMVLFTKYIKRRKS